MAYWKLWFPFFTFPFSGHRSNIIKKAHFNIVISLTTELMLSMVIIQHNREMVFRHSCQITSLCNVIKYRRSEPGRMCCLRLQAVWSGYLIPFLRFVCLFRWKRFHRFVSYRRHHSPQETPAFLCPLH